MEIARVTDQLGGTRVLGAAFASDLEWIAALENGFPPEALDAAIDAGILSRREAEHIVIPRRTLAHRKQKGQRLTLEESDRLLRIARVSAQAEEAFGNRDKASRWLRKPNRILKNAVPLELLRTSTGTELVREELIRIQHGIYA